MWTSENRARYDRSHLRYPSDLTDDEWELVEPLIPPGKRWRWQAYGDHAGGGERPDVHSLDRLSVARDPERPAAEKLAFTIISICGVGMARSIASITRSMKMPRSDWQREASPTAAIIDSQSVKSAEKDAMGQAARQL